MTWQNINSDLHLFKLQQEPHTAAEHSMPLLLLHGTLAAHHSWNQLAAYLRKFGVADIYAIDVLELQTSNPNADSAIEQIRDTIHYIRAAHPEYPKIVLIGYGVGGIMAYRYWQTWTDEDALAYLFTLATPHHQSSFPNLSESVVNAARQDEQEITNPVDFSRVGAVNPRSPTILINIFGTALGIDFDGVVRGLRLPEAANFELPLRHEELNKDDQVGTLILSCLRGERLLVRLRLVGIQMRRDDGYGRSGPISFDIDGERMPPDVVFQPTTDRMYLFEEAVPPLCTLSYPVEAVSATVTIHLRDLSDASGRRRRMYTRFHIPLTHEDSTTHTMQDSEGSDFLWRIVCQQMTTVLGEPWYDKYSQQIIRGI